MFLICLVVVCVILLIVDRWKPRRFMQLHQQLGNDWPYVPVLGNALKLIGNNEDRAKTLLQLNAQIYKSKNKAISFWIANKLAVGIADGDQAAVILKTCLDKKYIHKFMKDCIGNGSVFAPVEFWHPRRKTLVPTFAPRNVNQFVPIFEAQNMVTAEILQSRVGKDNFSCYDIFSAYTLDSVCETVFGVNMNMQRQPDHPVFNILKQCLKNITARAFQPWLHIDAIYKMLPVYKKQTHMMKIANEFLDDLICKTKAKMEEKFREVVETYYDVGVPTGGMNYSYSKNKNTPNSTDKSGPAFKTFVELIVENSQEAGKGFTHEEIREETIVLAVAGTDTTAVGISFTLLLLAHHQDVQDNVCREIEEVLGDSDKPLKVECLLKLKYTRAVIKESLRLYPPVPLVTRHCENDLELPTGIVLPKGTDVGISIWGIHRNPEHWGEDANEFNPNRFMTGDIPNNAFIPFSYGPRNCVGQQYAMLSMTTTLVTMLRRYRFTPATNFKYDENNLFRVTLEIMLKNVDNFSCRVENRDIKK